ncbi:MAG: alpha/beta fold hydrolase [Marmoricola sp.]
MVNPVDVTVERVNIHGHDRAYVKVGSGPALLLLHGLACNHTTWLPVIRQLAKHYTVIAPDLLGHGESAKPRADYSVAGYANGMRDLMTVLNIDKVTVVGHSFGGGVAMQFAYQFPERTERLVLVSSGGLGREVTHLIRMITLPGWELALGVATLPGIRHVGKAALRALHNPKHAATRDLAEVAEIYEALSDPRARFALRRLVTGVIDLRGQVVTMRDRAYLTQAMPILVIWGTQDLVLPVTHTHALEAIAPGAVVELFEDSGHFPHKDQPDRFVKVLHSFIRNTNPASYHRGRWRALLRNGAGPRPDLATEALVRHLAEAR